MKNAALLFVSICLFAMSCKKDNEAHTVKNVNEFNDAVAHAQPGSVITLANGVWKDAELVFEGIGREAYNTIR